MSGWSPKQYLKFKSQLIPLRRLTGNYRYLLQKLSRCDGRLGRVCLIMILVGLGIPLTNVLLPKLLIWAALLEPPSWALMLGILLAFFAVSMVCNAAHNYYLQHNGVYLTNFGFKLREDIQEISMTMPFAMTEDSATLDRIKLAKTATYQVQSIIETFCRCVSAILLLIGYSVLLMGLHPLLMPLFLVCILLNAASIARYNRRRAERRESIARIDRKKDYLFQTMFDYRFGKDLRLYNMDGIIAGKFIAQKDKKYRLNTLLEKKHTAAQIIEVILEVVCEAAIYLFLLQGFLRHAIQVDDFVLYTGLAASFQIISRGLIVDLGQLFLLSVAIGDYRAFVEADWGQQAGDALCGEACMRASAAESAPAEIRFEGVSFRYPGGERDILQDLSFTIEAGSHVSIVGLNGAGKSTIVKLICRLYPPTGGHIYLDGRDIQTYAWDEYRTKLAAVFQESRLFACSLQENITLADDPDLPRMWEALRAVGMEEKVRALPQGAQSNVLKYLYEDGVEFSGGETQRLCIARAVYREGNLLLLDEPTAALDALAEKEIYESFSQASKGKTTVFISHRLNSNRFCDKVLFLEGGKIAAWGSHEQLLKDYPPYRELYELQAKSYRSKEAVS